MQLERRRQADLGRSLDHLDVTRHDGSAAFVAQTTTAGSYPTVAQCVYALEMVQVDGPETEGAVGNFVADAWHPVFGVNLGSSVPPIGQKVLVHCVGGRYVFRFDG